MDGTLVDSSKILVNTINYVRQNLALKPLTDQKILEAINNPDVYAPMFFYGVEEYSEFHQALFTEYYQANYKQYVKVYSGLKELLARLSKTHRLSVATNAYKKSASSTLFTLGIEHYFEIVVCGDEVPKPKPDPFMIDIIKEFYSDDLDKFLLIGDSSKDMQSAKSANIDFLLVEWGFSSHDNSITTVNELENLLYPPS
jgi:phosphoglycolate phosphatase